MAELSLATVQATAGQALVRLAYAEGWWCKIDSRTTTRQVHEPEIARLPETSCFGDFQFSSRLEYAADCSYDSYSPESTIFQSPLVLTTIQL